MALNKLKRELDEKAAQAALAEKNKRKADDDKEQMLREYKDSQRPALRCLQSLEGLFRECVNDFSRLANLKIAHSNRPMWLFRLAGQSSATIDDPKLYVSFDASGWDRNTIQLEVFLRQGLQFSAEYSRMGHYSQGVSFPHETYVLVRENLPVESFEIQAAHKWLESNFEEYYRRLTDFRNKK